MGEPISYMPDRRTKASREESERRKLVRGLQLFFLSPAAFVVFALATQSVWAAAVLGFAVLTVNQVHLERSAPYLTGFELPLPLYLRGVLTGNVGAFVATIVGVTLGFQALEALKGWAGIEFSLPSLWPVAPTEESVAGALLWSIPVFFVADFLIYSYHRSAHQNGEGLRWRVHSVHHSIPRFTLSLGSRAHPVETIITFSFVGIAGALLGVGGASTTCAAVVILFIMSAHHIDCDTHLGPLGWLLVTTDVHRWHHNIDSEDSGNYGLLFQIWDRLLGTHHRPEQFAGRIGVEDFEPYFPSSQVDRLLLPIPSRRLSLVEGNRQESTGA